MKRSERTARYISFRNGLALYPLTTDIQMKVQELIAIVAENPTDNIGDMDDNLVNNHKIERVAMWLDIDSHRHYELETFAYKCEDWFAGVKWVSKLYSEMSSYEDIWEDCVAFEMQEVQTTTYIRK